MNDLPCMPDTILKGQYYDNNSLVLSGYIREYSLKSLTDPLIDAIK